VTTFFFLGIFVYFYFSQPRIYSISIPFKTVSKHTVSTDLTSFLPVENSSSVSLNELSVSLSSYAFYKSFSEMLLQEKTFDRLNFGTISNGNSLYGTKIRKNCKNNNICMVEALIGAVSGTFQVDQGLTDNRFVLTISALNNETVTLMGKIIVKAIENNRIQISQYLVVKEMDSVDNLIKESRSIIEGLDGFKILEENEKIQANISDLKDRSRTLLLSINAEISNLSALEARVKEVKKSLEKSSKIDKLSRLYEVSTQGKIEETRQNIANLSNVSESNRSDSDKLILSKLINELQVLEDKHPKTGRSIANLRSDELFNKDQENHEKNNEFEYYVSKNKLANLEEEYRSVKEQLDELSKDKVSKEAFINKIKTDFEFLKNLESKKLSLKLMSSTTTSDLLFEEFGKGTREFRRSTIFKTFMFCFFISIFLYTISVLIRYFMDDRIYSEDDLKAYFTDLEFLGEVPSFD
jgi:hypothetical protein